jgi:anti-sigma B factor antagonist
MEGIQVSTEITGSANQISIIRVGGYIDTTTSSELERALDTLLKQKRFNIIVDLGNVDYISSAGWGIFISEIKSIRENNGDLKLVRMIPDVYEIFELLEFHHILDVYDALEEAIEQFEANPVAVAPGSDIATAPKMVDKLSKENEVKAQAEQQAQAMKDTATPTAEVASNGAEGAPSTALSLEDKIIEIVKVNPAYGPGKIRALLQTEAYGFTRAGWFKVRRILKQKGLGSKESRFTFAMQNRG